jgi:Fe-S cluster assembly ATPase SufC
VITLKKLTWSNCFSYGSGNELNLNESIVNQLVGTNGTGKSSIPLILEEVLFNKNSKGIKKADIPNREVNKGYDIGLTF